MNDITIDSLPPEILLMIFRKLKICDMKKAMLVSKKWKGFIEDPELWRHFISKPVYPDQVGRLLNIPRLCLMKKLEMRTGKDNDSKEMILMGEIDGKNKYSIHRVRRAEDENIAEILKSEVSDLNRLTVTL